MSNGKSYSTWLQVKITDVEGCVVRTVTVALPPTEYHQLQARGKFAGYVQVDIGHCLSVTGFGTAGGDDD